MSGRFASFVLLWLPILLVCFSCIEDTKNTLPAVEGRWEIIRGLRNGRETGTLSGTYFRFGTDGKMITNLPIGPEIPVEYELTKSLIQQKGASPVDYSVLSLNDTTLVLGFEMRGMQFEMYLRKAMEPEPVLSDPQTLQSDTSSPQPIDSIQE
ncbi:MAG: hypothetical protein ACKVU2_03565 [Saprospiraceae bacterium]